MTIDAGGNSTSRSTPRRRPARRAGPVPDRRRVAAANGATGQDRADRRGHRHAEAGAGDGRPAARHLGHANSREAGADDRLQHRDRGRCEDVQARRHRADGLGVSFDPQTIADVKPNETAQVTAIIKPAKDAVAGDYAMTVRSSAGSESSNVDLRYTLQGSRTLGFVAIGVIVVAFARPRRRVRQVRPTLMSHRARRRRRPLRSTSSSRRRS